MRKLKRAGLEILRLNSAHQGRKVPTISGMLLFGKVPASHFPDAWIQAGRYSGKDKARIVDKLHIRSYPVEVFEAAIAFVQKRSLHGAGICVFRRKSGQAF